MALLVCSIVLLFCAIVLSIMEYVYYLSFGESIFSLLKEVFLDDDSE